MTIAYRGGSSGFSNNDNSYVYINYPTGIAAGDLMILSRAAQSAATIPGWTQIMTDSSSPAITGVYYKYAEFGVETTGGSLTVDNGVVEREGIAVAVYYSNLGKLVPNVVGTVNVDTNTASHSTGTITTTSANELVVSLFQGRENNDFGATFATAGSGYTGRVVQYTGQQTFNLIGDEIKATAGTTTARTCTTDRNQNGRNLQISFKEVVDRYPAAVLADSPILYWRLNETNDIVMHDVSGHGRDGSIGGSVGLNNDGLVPNDDDPSIYISSGNYLKFSPGVGDSLVGTFSIELWGRWDYTYANSVFFGSVITDTGAAPALVSQGSKLSIGYYGFDLTLGNGSTSQTWSMNYNNPVGTYNVNSEVRHVVLSVDGTALTASIYVNGISVLTSPLGTGSSSATAICFDHDHSFFLGSDYSDVSNSYYSYGLYDEFAIYSVALTQAQASRHFYSSKPQQRPVPYRPRQTGATIRSSVR